MHAGTEHCVLVEDDELEILVLDLELPEPDLPELTATEREVALRVGDGLGNAEIAAERGVALRTIANQVRSIFQKLGVCSRWDLALLLTRRSLEAAQPLEAPAVITERRRDPAPARSGIVNSPATVGVLRAAYATRGADFDETRARLGIALVGAGALAREDYCALFDRLAAEAGRPALGLELARDLPVGTLGLLEWLGLSAPTLGDALMAVSEHGGLLHEGGRRVTRARGDQLVISYCVEGLAPPRSVVDWSFGCLYQRIRATAGAPLEPLEVRVQYADPGDGRAEEFFGCPVRFEAPANEIVLRRELADLPLPTGDRDTFDALSAIARRRSRRSEPPLVARAREAVARDLELRRPPRPESVARALGVSAAALHRGLAQSGAAFDQIVLACGLDTALRRLEGTGAGPREVAGVIRAQTSRVS